MKYMSFLASCSYAGLANLLASQGVDTDDRTIALEMGLPFLVSRDACGSFSAGPMLQSARWFDLFLLPHGFHLEEQTVSRADVPRFLSSRTSVMLGVHVTEHDKHAVIFQGCSDGIWHFLNNKRPDDPVPEEYAWSEEELSSRLDEAVIVSALVPCRPQHLDTASLLRASVQNLSDLETAIRSFCRTSQTPQAQRAALNRLFRPLLLDGITMMELLEEDSLVQDLTGLQASLLRAMRDDRSQVLSQELDLPLLSQCIHHWQSLIRRKMEDSSLAFSEKNAIIGTE